MWGVRKGIVLALILMALTILSGCEKESIKVGFIGSLTSKNSQLSIDARNAIVLGVDQINAEGGIKGRKVELIIKDDGADPEIAMQRHSEFRSEEVRLVIGHMTSNMSEVVLASQGPDLMFVSPSMGASALTGKDDYFLRTSPLSDNQAWTFFELVEMLKIKHAVILYDVMNATYTENMANYAKELNDTRYFINLTLVPFDSRVDNLMNVTNTVLENESVELVLMISQAIDTAVIAQSLKTNKPDLILSSVSWSMTEDLIINGGKAVEGMYFIGLNKSEVESDILKGFKADFYDQYQYEASFVSLLGYDAFTVLMEGLKVSTDDSPEAVKQSILKTKVFNGLDETFEMDQFGDNNKKYLIYQLINSEFMPQFN